LYGERRAATALARDGPREDVDEGLERLARDTRDADYLRHCWRERHEGSQL
jgi:hypothetical protein